jgi:nucleoside-diphosphate-sugar epimerase
VHGVARRPNDVGADVRHSTDLLDPAAVAALVREARPSHLVHLAWTTTPGRYWADPANLAWARATLALMDGFVQAGGARAVLAGSCAQYDWSREALGRSGVASETATPRRPATLYGAAKQATSELLDAWASEVGLSYATAVLFFPYGPFEKPERLVPSVARRLLAGAAAPTSAGTQVRDFIHVDDCGEAIAALLDSDVTGAVNVGTGDGSPVVDVATTIARILGREDLLRIGALPADDAAPRVVAAVRRLHEDVGFVPRHDLETGLAETVEWWRALGAVDLTGPGEGNRPVTR